MDSTRWDDKWDYAMIPKAIKQAESVQPGEEIRLMWEGQIYRDIEQNRFSSFRKFIHSLIP